MVSPTPNKGYTYPAHGGAVGAWDTPLNTDFDTIDLNIGGFYNINVGSSIAGATYNSTYATLSSTVTSATLPSSIAANLMYKVSGTLSSNLSVVMPSAGGLYLFNNQSSGAYSLTVCTAAGSSLGFSVTQGGGSFVAIDGTNAFSNTNALTAPVSFSQLQTQASNSLLGNISSATGTPAAVPLGSGFNITPSSSTSAGSISVTGFAPTASFKNLTIRVTGNTTVSVTADYVTMSNGTSFVTAPISATGNLGSAGAVNQLDAGAIAAATFYSVWAIYNPTTAVAGTLYSTSTTLPTLPSGFTYYARIGWVVTASAVAQLMGTLQLGRRAQYVVGSAQTSKFPQLINTGSAGGSITTPAVWLVIPVNSVVPPTASVFKGFASPLYGGGRIMIAPNNASTGGYDSTSLPPYLLISASGTNTPFDLLLETLNVYWASNAGGFLACTGWEDNI